MLKKLSTCTPVLCTICPIHYHKLFVKIVASSNCVVQPCKGLWWDGQALGAFGQITKPPFTMCGCPICIDKSFVLLWYNILHQFRIVSLLVVGCDITMMSQAFKLNQLLAGKWTYKIIKTNGTINKWILRHYKWALVIIYIPDWTI